MDRQVLVVEGSGFYADCRPEVDFGRVDLLCDLLLVKMRDLSDG